MDLGSPGNKRKSKKVSLPVDYLLQSMPLTSSVSLLILTNSSLRLIRNFSPAQKLSHSDLDSAFSSTLLSPPHSSPGQQRQLLLPVLSRVHSLCCSLSISGNFFSHLSPPPALKCSPQVRVTAGAGDAGDASHHYSERKTHLWSNNSMFLSSA